MAKITPDDAPPSPLLTTPTTSPSTPSSAPPAPAKLKRFLIETYDIILLKAVRCVDAHVPDWGKPESLYEDVLQLFFRDVPAIVFVHSQIPSAKTLADRFKRLVLRRRKEVKATAAASGIIEKHGEKEVLLDHLILKMDEKEEAAKAEDQHTENEERLVAAGEHIRSLALKWRQEESDGDDTPSSGKKRRRSRLESGNSDDEVTASMLSQVAFCREMEKGRLEQEQQRMEVDQERVRRETDRFEKAQASASRWLGLDEKRFELEKEERKQSLAERKEMMDVMEMLCKKLL